MGDSEAKARAKLAEADKKSRGGGGGFFGLFKGGGGLSEAADTYIQAGNLFKIAKLWNDAGAAFVRSAECYEAQGDARHDVATQYAEAANCYRKTNPKTAVDCLKKTAEIYTDMGRFNMAAKIHVTMGELYETELPDKAEAIVHYQKATDYYLGEESRSSACKCQIKVAQYSADLEQWRQAIKVFEEVALWEADHATLKYAAKNHFFQALLCWINLDKLDAQHALRKYVDASPAFADSREAKLIGELLKALEHDDADGFEKAVAAYDKISKLDAWHTSVLLHIKKTIGGGVGGGGGGEQEDEDDLK